MNKFQELDVWKKSKGLIKTVYAIAEKLPKSEDYNLKQQLKRCIVSVSLNIAEGKNRYTDKEFANFINISKGSLAEAEAILVICEELHFFKVNPNVYNEITELGKMLTGLYKYLKVNSDRR
jgi:four helix bundle protein